MRASGFLLALLAIGACDDAGAEGLPGDLLPLSRSWRARLGDARARGWEPGEGGLRAEAPPPRTFDVPIDADAAELLMEYRWSDAPGPKVARLRLGPLVILLDAGNAGTLQWTSLEATDEDRRPTMAVPDGRLRARTEELVEASLGRWNRLVVRWSDERARLDLNGVPVNEGAWTRLEVEAVGVTLEQGALEIGRLAAR